MANIKNTKSNTLVSGTSVNDTINNSAKNVTINAGNGNDKITNSASNVSVFGNSGNDTIYLTGGTNVTLHGGAGNDKISVTGGSKITINGGSGNDTITGSSAAEVIQFRADGGSDIITNFGFNDTLHIASGSLGSYYADGNDLIVEAKDTKSASKIRLSNMANSSVKVKVGKGSVKTIKVEKPVENNFNTVSNTLFGGTSNRNFMYNYASKVTINGDAGNDTLTSFGDKNSLNGGANNDLVQNFGGLSVTLNGDAGNDTLTGSSDGETFVFGSSHGNDLITNFGKNDTLYIAKGTIGAYSVKNSNLIIPVGSVKVTLKGAAFTPVQIAYPSGVVETITGYEVPDPDGVKAFVSETLSGTFDLNTYNSTSKTKAVNIYATTNQKSGLSLYGDNRANEIWSNNADYECYLYGNKGNDIIHCGTSRDKIHYYYGDGNDTLYGYGSYRDEIILHDCAVTDVKVNDSAIILNLDSGNSITLKDSFNKSITIPNIGTYTFAGYRVTNDKFAIPLGATGHFDMRDHTLSSESKITKLDASANKTSDLSLYGDDRANEIWANNADYECYLYGNKGNDIIHCGTSRDKVHYYYGDGNDTLYGYGSYRDEIILHDCAVTDVKVNDSAIILNLDSGNSITLKDSFNKSIYIPGIGNQTYTKPSSNQMSIEENNSDEYWFMQTDNSIGSELDSIVEVKDISIDMPTDFNDNLFKQSAIDRISVARHRSKIKSF